MGPEKTARNMLLCDGCQKIIPLGCSYRIDRSGYLLCSQCAEKGDLPSAVAV